MSSAGLKDFRTALQISIALRLELCSLGRATRQVCPLPKQTVLLFGVTSSRGYGEFCSVNPASSGDEADSELLTPTAPFCPPL